MTSLATFSESVLFTILHERTVICYVAEGTSKNTKFSKVCYGEAAGGGDAQSKSNIILLRRKVVFYSFVHSISTELAIKCQQQHFL